jgi:hypothetical protein
LCPKNRVRYKLAKIRDVPAPRVNVLDCHTSLRYGHSASLLRPRSTHRQTTGAMPALRQHTPHPQRHATKKLEIVQLWQCKLCRRVFTPAPPSLRYKTYPLRVILDGVTLYNLGHSLPVAAQKLRAKHGYRIPPSTLASWMAEHRELTTYGRIRRHRPNGLSPAQTIRSTKLYHRQVYSFA